jgi:hypothetical protein
MSGIATDLAAMIRRYAAAVDHAQADLPPGGSEPPRQGPDEIRMVADRVELIDEQELANSLGIEFHFSIEDRDLGSYIEVRVGGWIGIDRAVDFRDPALKVLDVITPGELMRDDEQDQS